MIENYSLTEWIAFFFIYSFLGWCIESTIVSVTRRKLINRGFLKGPMLPLYGFGALIILFSTLWAKDNYILVYICGMISATCLEYVTGVVMEMMFNMRYWDYSTKKFNIQGYICLKSSLFWGVLSVVMVCFVHVPIAAVVCSVSPSILKVCVLLIVGVAAVDTANAFKKAFDFQKLMSYETRIKQELADITDRLAEAKEAFADRNTEKQIEFFNKQEERAERLRLELDAAKEKAGKFKNSVLKSFPTATSSHFGEVLEEFKGYWNTKK
jgi:uncharacterized membrane protein